MKKFMKREWKEREIEKTCNIYKNVYLRKLDKIIGVDKENEKLENEVKRYKNEKDDYKELYEILSQKYKKLNLENKKHRFHSKFIRNYVLIATIVVIVLSFIEGYLIVNA